MLSLAHEPMDVGTLAQRLSLDASSISHHLHGLRKADLVTSVRDKRRRVYYLGKHANVCVSGTVVELVLTSPEGVQIGMTISSNLSTARQPTHSSSCLEQACSNKVSLNQ